MNLDNLIKRLLFFYIIYLTIFCFFIFPCPDTFYYFEWSKHLQLSYFDGPPLIAYLIRVVTAVFGHTIFALNFVGVICMVLTSYFIYQIAKIVSPKHVMLAPLFWITYPFIVTRAIIINVTYDSLECLMWVVIVYTIICYLRSKNVYLIYVIGILGGLLLLSKYQGIILLTGLLMFFVLDKNSREIYKSKHIYISMILCLVIFSPVIIWNYQNNWESFRFQLNDHLWSNLNNNGWHVNGKIAGCLFYVWNSFFGVAHILILFLAFIFIVKNPKIKNDETYLLWFLICYTALFWGFVSPFGHVSMNYLLPLVSLMIIVSVKYMVLYDYAKISVWICMVFILISSGMMLDKSSHEKALKQWCRLTKDSCFNFYIKAGVIHGYTKI